jgi:hypothetical protein
MTYIAALGFAGQREGGTGTPGTTNMAKASGIAITAGDVCNSDTGTAPDSLRTAPTSGTGPFYVCTETAPIGQTGVSVCYDGEVIVQSDGSGAIEPNQVVVTSAAAAGKVAGRAAEAANRCVGVYLRHVGEKSGASSAPTAVAAAVEKIVIRLGAQV